jgi:hypothetical protein
MDSTKSAPDTLRQTRVFLSSGNYGSPSEFQCFWGMKCWCTFFHARVGLERFPEKECWVTLPETCVFVSCGIYGSRSAFWSIQGVKRDRTIFHARVGLLRM